MRNHVVEKDTGIMGRCARNLQAYREEISSICASITTVVEQVGSSMQDESGRDSITKVREQVKDLQKDLMDIELAGRALSKSSKILNELEQGDHFIRADGNVLFEFSEKLKRTLLLISQEYADGERLMQNTMDHISGRLESARSDYGQKKRRTTMRTADTGMRLMMVMMIMM